MTLTAGSGQQWPDHAWNVGDNPTRTTRCGHMVRGAIMDTSRGY